MTTRDEARAEAKAQAEIEFPARLPYNAEFEAQIQRQVGFIEGAEWQASRKVEVTTAEELDALPLDAVVVDFAGVPRTKRAGNSHMPGGWTHAGNSPLRSRELADGHPMQVIYAGRAALGGGE